MHTIIFIHKMNKLLEGPYMALQVFKKLSINGVHFPATKISKECSYETMIYFSADIIKYFNRANSSVFIQNSKLCAMFVNIFKITQSAIQFLYISFTYHILLGLWGCAHIVFVQVLARRKFSNFPIKMI